MRPSQAAQKISDIALRVRMSSAPDRKRVAKALKRLAGEIDPSPSQLFSQALLHGFDLKRSLEEAMTEIERVGAQAGLDATIIEDAKIYAQHNYHYYT